MTIKIKQVNDELGHQLLEIQYDHEGETRKVIIDDQDIIDRARELKQLLGRRVTLEDARLILVQLINEIREEEKAVPETFDFRDYIDVELET